MTVAGAALTPVRVRTVPPLLRRLWRQRHCAAGTGFPSAARILIIGWKFNGRVSWTAADGSARNDNGPRATTAGYSGPAFDSLMSDTPPASPSVLIVEDEELTASLLTFLLERERYTIHLATDGQAGLDYIKSHAPTSIVVMDVMLPFVDGFELLRQLRADPAWHDTRVLMLSARSQGPDIARAFDAGADDYLVKPFKPEELFARIRRYRPAGRSAT